MRLALALGKTLGELNDRLDETGEWPLWLAYNEVEPIPEPWLQTGLAISASLNAWGAKTKPEDFMPVRKVRKSKKQTSKQMKAAMGGWISLSKKKHKE